MSLCTRQRAKSLIQCATVDVANALLSCQREKVYKHVSQHLHIEIRARPGDLNTKLTNASECEYPVLTGFAGRGPRDVDGEEDGWFLLGPDVLYHSSAARTTALHRLEQADKFEFTVSQSIKVSVIDGSVSPLRQQDSFSCHP